ncbi:PP2C family protein-serine/threonine phosphatase [Candidatus Methylocalor cossyra]|uniref:Response regulator n=1 Tax=Candidatus Methylocalor cossyra TaxID=3108543 RepID=A0ABM9NH19_9GAMM
MKILIAEDEAVSRHLLQRYLERLGFQVVAAADGAEAWRRFEADDFAIVISDWLMPEMDGLDLIRRIRAHPSRGYVYTILVTVKFEKRDLVAAMEAGADDFITKPFDPEELRVRVRAGQRVVELESALFRSLEELKQAHLREMETGARIQKALLQGYPPHIPPGLRVAACTLPSEHIDGDFYDFYLHHHRCLDILVGDVMGKGVPAALLGAGIKYSFARALGRLMVSLERDRLPEPEEIVSLVHAEMTPQFIRLESFATLCYARFDLDRHFVTFVDCGHPKTLHFRAQTRVVETLQGENLPLGFTEQEIYRQVARPFDLGDVFVFYSDGLTEAQNHAGDFFEAGRLAELVARHGELDPADLIERIRDEVAAFSDATTFTDDLTCVVVKIEPWPSRSRWRSASPRVSETAFQLASAGEDLHQAEAT